MIAIGQILLQRYQKKHYERGYDILYQFIRKLSFFENYFIIMKYFGLIIQNIDAVCIVIETFGWIRVAA